MEGETQNKPWEEQLYDDYTDSDSTASEEVTCQGCLDEKHGVKQVEWEKHDPQNDTCRCKRMLDDADDSHTPSDSLNRGAAELAERQPRRHPPNSPLWQRLPFDTMMRVIERLMDVDYGDIDRAKGGNVPWLHDACELYDTDVSDASAGLHSSYFAARRALAFAVMPALVSNVFAAVVKKRWCADTGRWGMRFTTITWTGPYVAMWQTDVWCLGDAATNHGRERATTLLSSFRDATDLDRQQAADVLVACGRVLMYRLQVGGMVVTDGSRGRFTVKDLLVATELFPGDAVLEMANRLLIVYFNGGQYFEGCKWMPRVETEEYHSNPRAQHREYCPDTVFVLVRRSGAELVGVDTNEDNLINLYEALLKCGTYKDTVAPARGSGIEFAQCVHAQPSRPDGLQQPEHQSIHPFAMNEFKAEMARLGGALK